jgi:YHS domain-containing protein
VLIRFVIFFVFLYLLYRIIKYFRTVKKVKMNNSQFQSKPAVGEDLVEDPACHTYIPVSQAYKREIAGKNFYFCSKECSDGYIFGKNNERQQ